ncbi:unnamed protein product [Coffea canephora]|uniref:Methyltransferase type 11 domain-containing protein n=1 Tax=Coffea canephora TaxID=49390 RepID=A0A068V9J8_COFCA|nr:unnamed protein product [Coffea canephora]
MTASGDNELIEEAVSPRATAYPPKLFSSCETAEFPKPLQRRNFRLCEVMLNLRQNPNSFNSSLPSNPRGDLFSVRTSSSTLLSFKCNASLEENNNQIKQSSSSSSSVAAGKIRRLVLTQQGRTKLNPKPDPDFYAYPRFVTHVDRNFISILTNLYRNVLKPESEILDLMSSWVSHLPPEVKYKKVVGHGLNAVELARNPRLDYFFVKDLNREQELQFESCSFDAVLCAVSVQYLQQPEKVFAEVFRVLRPGGVFIVSFSNRLFYEKAISAWRDGTSYGRVQLVVQYFQSVEGFTQPRVIRKLPTLALQEKLSAPFGWIMNLVGLLSGSDPFYAVLAHKNFKPIHE